MAAPAFSPARSAYVSEVVVQGVRRFGEVRRFALGPGYNVLLGLSAAGKSTLYDVLMSLLFVHAPDNEAETFRSMLPQAAGTCRAGMSLSLGGETFRVLKDYAQASVTLSKFLPGEKRFELVSNDPGVIKSWLEQNAGLPIGASYPKLFTWTRSDFPSTTEGVNVAPIRRDSSDTGFEERIRALPLAEKRALLAQLLDEFRRQAEVKTTEYLQDGLRGKLFEVEQLIGRRNEIQRDLDELMMELKDIEKLPKLPDGIDERIEAYKRQVKTKEAEMEHLIPRQDDAHGRLAMVIPYPFSEQEMKRLTSPVDVLVALVKKNRIFDGGLAAIPVGIVLASVLSGALAGVGVLVAFGGVGVSIGWQWLFVFQGGQEKYRVAKKEVDAIDEQVRLIERKHDIETTVVRNLLKAYGVDSPTEMKEMEKRRDELVAKRDKLRAKMSAVKFPDGGTDFDTKKASIQKQITQIDERLQGLSGNFTTDPKDLEPQIERLDREVARAEGRKPTPRAKLFGRDEKDEAAGAEGKDSIQKLVESWCAARDADLGKLLRAVQEAFAKNLRALSGGRYGDAVFDAAGSVAVREDGKAPIPFESLDAVSKDAAYMALRVTLLQLEAKGAGATVAIFDDPFDFEEPRLAAISRALKALSPAQVIHLTSRPVHMKSADKQIEI